MLETSSQQREEEEENKRGKERIEAKEGEDQDDELVTSTETQAKEGRVWGRNKGEEQGRKGLNLCQSLGQRRVGVVLVKASYYKWASLSALVGNTRRDAGLMGACFAPPSIDLDLAVECHSCQVQEPCASCICGGKCLGSVEGGYASGKSSA